MTVNVVEELKKLEQNTDKKDILMECEDVVDGGSTKANHIKPKRRKESERKMKAEKNNASVKNHFVEFSYASKDGFERFEAVKEAKEIIRNAVRRTGGDMPKELLNAYEGLADVMDHIKAIELDVIRRGR